MRRTVYLDNHATTRIDPRVLDAMMPFLQEQYGNASSRSHEFGLTGAAAVDVARTRIARLIGAEPREITFTSGATESINLALKGVAEAAFGKAGKTGGHIITVATEHPAVLDTCAHLERAGFRVTVLPVDHDGRVSPDDIAHAVTDDTILVSVMWANNEIGTIAPMAELAALCASRGIVFHSDATQAVGKIPVDLGHIPVGLVSFSAHKMYGPKGIGALFVRKKIPAMPLIAQIDGGGHEQGLRSGTLNVPGIAGFGAAAGLGSQEMEKESHLLRELRDHLVTGIRRSVPEIRVNGHPVNRLPQNASITFPGLPADRLIQEMKGIAVATGAACSSARPGPSHVLKAIGLTPAEAAGTLRFGLGRFTTREEIDYTITSVVNAVTALQSNRQWSMNESARVSSQP